MKFLTLLCLLIMPFALHAITSDIVKISKDSPPELQYILAKLYEDENPLILNTITITRDYAKAYQFYSYAAQQGHVQSRLAIARFFMNGIHVEKNIEKALSIYKKMAEEGELEATLIMTRLYISGAFPEKNTPLVLSYLQSLAKGNNGEALGLLAKLYYEGLDVELNYDTAAEYAQRAHDAGDNYGSYILSMLYMRNIVKYIGSEAGISALSRAASRGNPKSQALLGLAYYHGKKVKIDLTRAYIWLKIANNNGNHLVSPILNEITINLSNVSFAEKMYLDTVKRLSGVLIQN